MCGSHGGKTARALAAAERRLQGEAARNAVVTYGVASQQAAPTLLTTGVSPPVGLMVVRALSGSMPVSATAGLVDASK